MFQKFLKSTFFEWLLIVISILLSCIDFDFFKFSILSILIFLFLIFTKNRIIGIVVSLIVIALSGIMIFELIGEANENDVLQNSKTLLETRIGISVFLFLFINSILMFRKYYKMFRATT